MTCGRRPCVLRPRLVRVCHSGLDKSRINKPSTTCAQPQCERRRGRWWCLGAGQAMAFLLSLEGGPASRSGYRSESLRRALLASSHARCQTFLGPGLTSGPWWGGPPLVSGPRCRWAHGALVGVGPGGATHAHRPPAPEPPRNGQGHQMRLADTA